MALRKAPRADLRREVPIYRQLGLILSLGLTIAAFTVPFEREEPVTMIEEAQEVIQIEEIDQTQQIEPPPPPPAALPPPQEVPDHVEVEADVIEDIDLDLTATILPPPAPPAAPPAATPTPSAPPPPPPPPPEPEPVEPEIFEVAEVQPELIGGLDGLQARVVYPPFAIQAGIEGQVVVQFVVDERGQVIDPVVLRSPNPLLSEAAVEAVLGSRFTPGQQRGRPVRVRYAVPVCFLLN